MSKKESACDSCPSKSENCEAGCDRKNMIKPQEGIKSVIAVMSGKGGVGKSTVTALLAGFMAKKGHEVGILDGDITGPSIPRLLGLKGGRIGAGQRGLVPYRTELGVKVMSLNLFFEREDEAVIWRGPMLAGAVKQFWEDVDWGELDFLFVDLPPGTGDVPLTVLQSLPLDGVIIVFSPQDLAIMIVKKALRMVRTLDVPVIGFVENMAYLECPECGKVIYPYGKPKGSQVSEETGVPVLATLPIQPSYTSFGDQGKLEMLETPEFEQLAERLEKVSACSLKQ
ncbi:MAG: Nucleotide-binding protein [Thermacetogenium phaeum]|uniref:Iron-sulfur cluster carrier protein n=1 Tax=Thermacetogenium phaeum TaxID=85874 RepID=A0A101FEW5_9THEO|nr:MAG: Nucleotide-binding protein [Thermacetogenium phaeum]